VKPKFVELYKDIAKRVADLSYARRLKVGAIVVKDDRIISMGYNGMPAGWENDCEYKDYMDGDAGGWLDPEEIAERWPHEEQVEIIDPDDGILRMNRRYQLKTRPEVLHAESNALAKLAKSNDSGDGADLFVTHSPCIQCAKLIYQSGIRRVYFGQSYRDDSGIKFLKQSGVEVIQHDE
jgi:dCMP deaminase